jgi:adenylate cyclase
VPAGERKHVTVLFADVVGSMDLAAGMDPEEWGELMERFFAILREGVNRFEGRIDKFTGDGIMALFGAPVAYEDHARRACAAALHLREELDRYRTELARDQGISFEVRMGLNSGEVVARSVGQDLKVEYTAVGNTVGLAQRMESLAEPGTVYVTAATAGLVGGYFEIRELGPMPIKGATESVAVFELVRRGAARTPLEVAAAKGFSRFVGRDREMAVLDGAFAEACQGDGQVIGVMAEPGLGKSRLCHEFVERCRARGVDVFVGHGLAHARSVPFVTTLEILRALFGIGEQDDPTTARDKVAGSVHELDPSLEEVLPLLWDFLGVADPERPAPAVDAEARQRQIFEALNRLRRARSDRGPFVMLIEDLHWLDPGSEAFLENLVGAVQGLRVLVVTTFRPEYHAAWAHRSHYGQLPLLPLRDEARDELLRDLLGLHPSLDGVAELVRERTGGNPFFIEEVVQGLVEEGSLQGERGAYQLASTIDEVRVPATVQAVLGARIDRLPERDKALLQTAAVVGRQFSRRVVGRVSGLAEPDLDAALRTLVEAELVYETAVFPEVEYTFKHGLTEEVAYNSQLARRRARIHTAVAEALAELDPEKLDERASLIARHYELGGELLEAARWNFRAATWAGLNNPTEALRHWRRVRTLTDRLGVSRDTAELAITARLQLLSLHWRLGAASEEGDVRFEDEAAVVYHEGEELADAIGQPGLKVFVLGSYGAILALTTAVSEGNDICIRAGQLADETGDTTLRAVGRTLIGWNSFILGRVRDAAAAAEQMVEMIGDDRSLGRGMIVTSPYAWCRMQVAHFGTYFRRLDDGLVALEQVIELLAEEGDFESQSWAHRHCAIFADLAGGDPDVAAVHARASVKWADEAGAPWSRGFNREGAATNHAHRGEWREAIETVDEALSIIGPRRIGLADVPLLLSIRARAQTGLGDVAGARSSAAEAVGVAVECGAQFYEAQARHQLARAILADPAPGEEKAARAELDHAMSIIQAHGIRSYAPHIHLELARLAEVVGDPVVYADELDRAHRLFVDVGAHGRAEEVASMVRAG